jgi:hypothetical protein
MPGNWLLFLFRRAVESDQIRKQGLNKALTTPFEKYVHAKAVKLARKERK